MNHTQTGFLAVALCSVSVVAQGFLPKGLAPGEQYRVIAVTDSVRDATSPSISQYDQFVANDIANSPLGGLNTTWQALVSTPSVDADVHTGTEISGGTPIFRPDGKRVFNNYNVMWSAWVLNRVNQTASGNPAPQRVWTGTDWRGQKLRPLGAGDGSSQVGRTASTFTEWMEGGVSSQSIERPLYALSGVLTVPTLEHPADLQPGDAYRILTVTDRSRDATATDIADYQSFVNTEVQGNLMLAGLQTNWRVLASTETTNGRDYTETDAPGGFPIYRIDGARVFDDYDHMWDTFNHPPLASPDRTLTLGTTTGLIWTGTNSRGITLLPLGASHSMALAGNPTGAGNSWTLWSSTPKTEKYPLYVLSDVIIVPLPAVETSRVGTPPNADALLPGQTGGPVIGTTWKPVIDHTTFVTDAALDFAMFGAAPANVPVPGLGTVLVDQLFGSISVAPGQQFSVALPMDPSLVGFQMSVQGLTLDWSWQLHVSNALDVTIGTE